MQEQSSRLLFFFLCVFMAIELYILSVGYSVHDMHISSIVVLLSGVLSGLLFLKIATNRRVALGTKSRHNILPNAVFFLVGGSIFYFSFDNIIQLSNNHPIDYYNPSGSDVIPQIGIMVNRFLDGQFPYTVINEWFETKRFILFPTYLPLQWLPYIAAEKVHLDYRVFVLIVFAVANLFLVRNNIKSQSNIWSTLFLSIASPLVVYVYMENDTTDAFKYCVELLIVSYYFLLAGILARFNWFWISILIAVCLLSRYSIVLWVPLFLLVLYRRKGRKIFFMSIGVMLLMFIVFYLPFLVVDPEIYFKGYEYHSRAALSAWRISSWQPVTDTAPYSLIHGVGIAIFFFENIAGEVVDKLSACRLSHLMASAGSVVLLAIWYLRNESRILPGVFLLGSLKIYLVVFYNFIQIPFIYLFWILPMISVVMLAVLLNLRLTESAEIS